MTLKTLNHPHPPVGEVPLLASRGASRKSGKLKQQIWKICRFDILRVNILDSRNFGFVGQAVCNLQAADVVSFNCHLVSSDLQSTFSFSRIVMQQHFFDVFNLEQNRNGCRSSANICNIFRNSCLSIWQIFGALGDLMMSQRLLNLTSSQPKKAITLPWILANSLVSSRRGALTSKGFWVSCDPETPMALNWEQLETWFCHGDLAEGLLWLKPMRSDNFILHSQHKVPIWHFVNWGFTLQKSDEKIWDFWISNFELRNVLEKVYSKIWRIFFIKTSRNGTWWNLHPGTLGMHGLLPKVYSAQWRLIGFPLLKPIDYVPTVSGFFGNPQGIHEINVFWT